jgi:selenocysteine-specific elongation factor
LAQLRLEAPGVAGRGDRLILRSYSPSMTIGGARVLDPLPRKRGRAEDLAPLRGLADVDGREAARRLLSSAGPRGIRLDELGARLSAPEEAVREWLTAPDALVFGQDPGVAVAAGTLDALAEAALRRLSRFHRESPLRPAMPREELRRQVFEDAPAGAFEHVLERLAGIGSIRALTDAVALAGHGVTLSSDESQAREALLEAARAAGLPGIDAGAAARALGREARLVERVVRLLLEEGRIVRVGQSQLVYADHLVQLKATVRERWPPGARLDVAGIKELTGLTRKFVIPLLEYLDRERVTRRSGNDRLVLSASA